MTWSSPRQLHLLVSTSLHLHTISRATENSSSETMQIYYYTETPVCPPPPPLEKSKLTRSSQQEDQRAPHRGEDLTAEDLAKLGVLSARMGDVAGVDALAAERGYKNRDEVVVSPGAMGDAYEARVRMFFDEHLHEDEEIRYIVDGQGYFDVRGLGDRWVRCALDPGDLIILPAGIWHRFTTDENNVPPPPPCCSLVAWRD